ncbi:MAG: 2-hydroxyacid dehydrogenase [Halocynthiibacter sp.]
MTLNVLFAARPDRWDSYEAPLHQAFEDAALDIDLRQSFAPDEVDYIIYAPNGPVSDFSPFTRCKAVLNLWAGVDQIVGNATLTQPLTRMVDYGLEAGMREWVIGHVMRYHLGLDAYITTQDGVWAPKVPPLARERRIGILGLGTLGQAVADGLNAIGFQVSGWSRTAKEVDNVQTYSGEDGLLEMLGTSDMVVLLLPDTPQTQNILNADRLALLPRGAYVINPGRGPLIEDAALIDALNRGQIAHATLDVFRQEPLPKDDPYWTHPSVTVTPHIASETRASTASEIIADNIKRSENGDALRFLVDRARGY